MFMIAEKKHVKFMYLYLKSQRVKLCMLLLLIAANIFLQVYNPQYIKSFIDAASAGEPESLLYRTALVFFLLTVMRQGVTIFIQLLTSDVTWKITNQLRIDLTRRCLAYDLSFHNRYTPGEMVDRIDGDVGKLNNFMSAFALKVISNNLLIVSIIVVIFFIHPLVGSVVLISSLLGLYVLRRMGKFGSNNIRNYLGEAAQFIGFIDERIAGREDIRAFRAEGHTLGKFYKILRSLYKVRKKTGFHIASVLNAGEIVLVLIMVSVIFTMGILYLHSSSLSLGTIFLIYFYITILLVPLKNLVAEVSDLQHVNASFLRINELLDYENKVSDTGTLTMKNGRLSVGFDKVSFRYVDAKPAVQDVSFAIPAGKTVGIIGRTGSGKSTLAKLLYRLCDAQEGSISVDGNDIKHFKLSELRSRIAIVSQNIELFEGTLRQNITMFQENVTDERVWEIMDVLSMRQWLDQLPEGLDHKIERDGKNLSAGEAQLIAFARAFIKNPGILIMDEATSRIDPLTERLVDRAIALLTKDRTVLMIAHKLSTIQSADFILVMSGGSLVEFDERVKLEANPDSVYASLIREGRKELA